MEVSAHLLCLSSYLQIIVAHGIRIGYSIPCQNLRGDPHLMAIRVLIADDSDVMRAAIAKTLKADPDLEVVGEATNFAETLERAGTL